MIGVFYMTRINVLDPVLLLDQHLLAEHRELKRIPNKILSGKAKTLDSEYDHYILGKGHETFFRRRLGYLYKRLHWLQCECRVRGFKVQNFSFYPYQFKGSNLWGDYDVTKEDLELNIDRIEERIRLKTKNTRYSLRGVRLTDPELEKYIKNLKNLVAL